MFVCLCVCVCVCVDDGWFKQPSSTHTPTLYIRHEDAG